MCTSENLRQDFVIYLYNPKALGSDLRPRKKKKNVRTAAAACRCLGAKSVSSCENLTSKRTLQRERERESQPHQLFLICLFYTKPHWRNFQHHQYIAMPLAQAQIQTNTEADVNNLCHLHTLGESALVTVITRVSILRVYDKRKFVRFATDARLF